MTTMHIVGKKSCGAQTSCISRSLMLYHASTGLQKGSDKLRKYLVEVEAAGADELEGLVAHAHVEHAAVLVAAVGAELSGAPGAWGPQVLLWSLSGTLHTGTLLTGTTGTVHSVRLYNNNIQTVI